MDHRLVLVFAFSMQFALRGRRRRPLGTPGGANRQPKAGRAGVPPPCGTGTPASTARPTVGPAARRLVARP